MHGVENLDLNFRQNCKKNVENICWKLRIGVPLHVFQFPLGFYPRDAMLARVFAIATCLSVRPSVCLSVCHTPVLCLAERKQDREMYTI